METIFIAWIIIGVSVIIGFLLSFKKNYRSNFKNEYDKIRTESARDKLVEKQEIEEDEEECCEKETGNVFSAVINSILVLGIVMVIIGSILSTTYEQQSLVTNTTISENLRSTLSVFPNILSFMPLFVLATVVGCILFAIGGTIPSTEKIEKPRKYKRTSENNYDRIRTESARSKLTRKR